MKKIGLDTETMGFDVYTKPLLSVQLGNKKTQIVVDCATVSIGLYKSLLESEDIEFLFWNAKFDLKFFFHQNIIIRNVWDGYLAEKLRWLGYPPGIHGLSLKSAAYTYLGVKLDKSVRGQIIYKGLCDETIVYGAGDVEHLEDIQELQLQALEKQGLLTAIIYENAFVKPLAYYEFCGVHLDRSRWKHKMDLNDATLKVFENALNDWVINSCQGLEYAYDYLQIEGLDSDDLEKARKKMSGIRDSISDIKGAKRGYYEAYKIPVNKKLSGKYISIDAQGDLFTGFNNKPVCKINWGSPLQTITVFKELGIITKVFDKETKTFKDSVDAKILEPQRGSFPIISVYLNYRTAQKIVSTYGESFLKQINPITQRIHTNFNQLMDTGRLSSGGKNKSTGEDYVNMQNLPNDEETRACFTAENGDIWISADYSGEESRVMADIANDQAMLDLFNFGCGDVHSLVAKMSYPDIVGDCPIEEIKKKFHGIRNDVKSYVEFPINYGGDANTIKMHSGKSMEESQKIYDNYMDGFKGIKVYQDFCRKDVFEKGYILLSAVTGHKAYIYDYEKLMTLKKSFTSDFWNIYRTIPRDENGKKIPRDSEEMQMVRDVTKYFQRKSDSEKQSINYRIQGLSAIIFKVASIKLYEWILEKGYFNIVKTCIPAHDEINIQCPEHMKEEVSQKLVECMESAGAYFCKKVKLPVDVTIGNHWIH